MKKICIITIYIGKLPDYFNVWLKSCENNKSIDFIIITDQILHDIPDNVKCINMSLEDLESKFQKKFDFKIKLKTPFKLCDYKPAYGYIFEEELTKYDYWGHCDIDLIFGDLRYFFNKCNLEKYNKFLPLGHLSLYKNNYENNRKFMEKTNGLYDYKFIFSSEKNFLFDELGIIRIYEKDFNTFFDKMIFADVWPKRKRYTLCTKLKYYQKIYLDFKNNFGSFNYNKQIFMWENGKIFQYYFYKGQLCSREYIYIHIQKRKWKLSGEFSNKMVISNNFVLSTEEKDYRKLINEYNRYFILNDLYDDIYGFIEHCIDYFKRKVLKINSNIIVEKNIERNMNENQN